MIGLILTALGFLTLGFSLGWFHNEVSRVRHGPFDRSQPLPAPPLPRRASPANLGELFAVPEPTAQG